MPYMSSPSSPEASRLRLPSSSAWRFSPLVDDVGGIAALHHHDAVIVGNDRIARVHIDARTNDRHVDRAERGFHRALGRDRFRPHRKAHLTQRFGIAHAGIDDQRPDAARHQRGREQIAEHAVGVVGGAADHEDVALLALLDRDMDHPVVAGMASTPSPRCRRPRRPARPDACKASSVRCGHRPRARWRRRARRAASPGRHPSV